MARALFLCFRVCISLALAVCFSSFETPAQVQLKSVNDLHRFPKFDGVVHQKNGAWIFEGAPDESLATAIPAKPAYQITLTNSSASKEDEFRPFSFPTAVYRVNNQRILVPRSVSDVQTFDVVVDSSAASQSWEHEWPVIVSGRNKPKFNEDFWRDRLQPGHSPTNWQPNWDDVATDYTKALNEVVFSKSATNSWLSLNKAKKLNETLSKKLQSSVIDLYRQLIERPNESPHGFSEFTLLEMKTAHDRLANERRSIERKIDDKAAYGGSNIFGPTVYLRMASNALAVMRIQRSDTKKLKGSGVYLGNGFFVTASHVFNGKPAHEFEIRFPDSAGNLSPPTTFQIKDDFASPPAGKPQMDLALCRITNAAVIPIGLQAVTPKAHLLHNPPSVLDEATPVYVIGYPNLSDFTIAVHDDCKIIIPRWVSPSAITDLFGRLTYANLTNQCKEIRETFVVKTRELAEYFKDIYNFDVTRPATMSNPTGYTARKKGIEIVGLDSDTFKGDSGGGVFEKQTGDLVALFLGGARDDVDVQNADAEVHEYALPVEIFWKHISKTITQP